MSALGTKCMSGAKESPFLEEGFQEVNLEETVYSDHGRFLQRLKVMRKVKLAAYALGTVTALCLIYVILHHDFGPGQGETRYFDVDQRLDNNTGAESTNHEVTIDVSLEPVINVLSNEDLVETNDGPYLETSGKHCPADLLHNHTGARDPIWSVSLLSEYANNDDAPTDLWSKEPVENRVLDVGHTRIASRNVVRSDVAGKGKGKAPLLPPNQEQSSSEEVSSSNDSTGLESLNTRLTYSQAVKNGKKYEALMDQAPKSKDKGRSWTAQQGVDQGWEGFQDSMRNPTPGGMASIMNDFGRKFNSFSSMVEMDWRHTRPRTSTWLKKIIQPTRAYYQWVFNPPAGIIFATNSHGPKEQGAKQRPPVTILPELHHWSDITWIEWIAACRGTSQPVNGLKKIVRCNIDNKDTKHIISKITQDIKPSSLGYKKRRTYKRGSNDYYALLGTENGVGAAYLLAQHQTSLGWKIIDSIELFYDDGKPYMVLNVNDYKAGGGTVVASGSSSSRKGGAIPGSSKGAALGRRGQTYRSAPCTRQRRNLVLPIEERSAVLPVEERSAVPPYAPFAGQSSRQSQNSANVAPLTYEEAVEKGKQRQANIDRKPTGQDEDTFNLNDLQKNGWKTTGSVEQYSFRTNLAPLTEILRKLPSAAAGKYAVDVTSDHSRSGGHYNNLYDAEGTVIVAWDNYGPEEKAKSKSQIPAMNHWSDVVFSQWRFAGKTVKPQQLRHIVRAKISNKHFESVADAIKRKLKEDNKVKEAQQMLGYPGLKIEYGTDDFYALLGTPSGAGPARLISGHKASLGWKEIRSIRLSFHDGFHWMVLEVAGNRHAGGESK